MWAAPGNGLNMKTLWTDTPYAMQRVAGLHEGHEITAAERDDLAHFIDHGWLLWRGAVEPDLIDQFAADTEAGRQRVAKSGPVMKIHDRTREHLRTVVP